MTPRMTMAVAVLVLGATGPSLSPTFAQNIPRDVKGRADLSGVWMRPDTGRLQNEPPPYTPAALARHQELRNRIGIDDPMGRCLGPGVPRSWTLPAPFKIIQLPDEIVVLYEFLNGIRTIPTNGGAHPDEEPRFYGTSVARWEGDTLVIDVRNFNGKTWLGNGATHHSDQLTIIERLRRTGPGSLSYEATLTDPVVFTKPWTIRHVFELRPDERIREYVCEETDADRPDAANLPKQ